MNSVEYFLDQDKQDQPQFWPVMESIYGKEDIIYKLIFISASEPRFGRFVTLQRVSSVESYSPLNWREVTVHTETSDTDTVKIAVAKNI